MRTGIASARCVVVDSCVSNGSLASGGDLPSRSSRWGRSSGGFRAWGRTSNAFCIFPLPKKPRSPPCFADEQSDTFAARSAKETAPDSICSLYAMRLVERSLLGLLRDVLPVGVAPGRGAAAALVLDQEVRGADFVGGHGGAGLE